MYREGYRKAFANFDAKKVAVFKTMKEVPPKTPLSEEISKDLNKRGFTFMGSTIVYAHMQATGMVNDHLTSCFRHKKITQIANK